MTNKELIEENTALKERVEDLAAKIILRDIADFNSGIRLKQDPFIPEYLGFTETIHRDKEDLLEARIYTKDGFNIAKHVDTDLKTWVIMSPKGEKNSLLIDNMYDGIAILHSCGMNVSLEDYFNQNIIEADRADARQVGLEAELSELEKEGGE